MTTAALSPGAAVFASSLGTSANCVGYQPHLLEAEVQESAIIMVARVEDAEPLAVRLRPEGFLKGPAQARPVELRRSEGDGECPWARFSEGDRYLVFLRDEGGTLQWPIEARAFLLLDGSASLTGTQPFTIGEDELVGQIRQLTDQFAVPPADSSEGAGIEWGSTVLPVAVALVIVFAIGLFLMRIWHRIDPS